MGISLRQHTDRLDAFSCDPAGLRLSVVQYTIQVKLVHTKGFRFVLARQISRISDLLTVSPQRGIFQRVEYLITDEYVGTGRERPFSIVSELFSL